AKIVSVFESCGLDGAKLLTFDNPGPLEMLLRKATNGETWVQQSIDALVCMLPEEAATATKKMGMDDDTREELAAAKEKSEQRRQRLEEEREEGGGRGGERGGERGGDRRDVAVTAVVTAVVTVAMTVAETVAETEAVEDDDRDQRGGGRSGGYQEKGKGRGKGDRREMQCNNCQGFGLLLAQPPPNELRFMFWNIDGLDEVGGAPGLAKRVLAVALEVARHRPLAVMLQEVIPPALEILAHDKVLGSHYEIVVPRDPPVPYFV
ncbi:unnamed protein product, partial [Polarella glacialis]